MGNDEVLRGQEAPEQCDEQKGRYKAERKRVVCSKKGPVDVRAQACKGHKADVQELQMKL